MFEDNPDKVAAAARALRRRDRSATAGPKDQPSQGVYDVLVQEARQLMAAGQFDQAEAKARQAQRMNVVPPLTADRAEAVLHDLAMARARQTPGRPPTARRRAGRRDVPPRRAAQRRRRARGQRAARQGRQRGRRRQVHRGRAAPGPGDGQAVGRRPAAGPAVAGRRPEGGPGPSRPRPPRPTARPSRRRPPRARPTGSPADGPRPPPRRPRRPRPAAASSSWPRPGPSSPAATIAAARQMADEAKAGQLGVDAQADELLAQIALAEQGGALSLYESALDALRKGDHGRARALLTEVAASGDALDEGLMQKVQDLLAEAPRATTAGKAARHRPAPARRPTPRPSRPRSSTPRSAPRSPRPAGSRRPTPTRRSPSTSTTLDGGQGRRAPRGRRPDDGPPPRGRHRAGQEGQGRLRRQDEGQEPSAPRSSRSGSGSSRPTRPRRTG